MANFFFLLCLIQTKAPTILLEHAFIWEFLLFFVPLSPLFFISNFFFFQPAKGLFNGYLTVCLNSFYFLLNLICVTAFKVAFFQYRIKPPSHCRWTMLGPFRCLSKKKKKKYSTKIKRLRPEIVMFAFWLVCLIVPSYIYGGHIKSWRSFFSSRLFTDLFIMFAKVTQHSVSCDWSAVIELRLFDHFNMPLLCWTLLLGKLTKKNEKRVLSFNLLCSRNLSHGMQSLTDNIFHDPRWIDSATKRT